MKKILVLILGLTLLAAACNKEVVRVEPTPTTETSEVATEPKQEATTEQPQEGYVSPKLTPDKKISISDLLVPKTEEEQDFDIDQSKIKNVEQDVKLDDHEERITNLEETINTPLGGVPTPTPTPTTPDPNEGNIILPPVEPCEFQQFGTVVVNVVQPTKEGIAFSYQVYHQERGQIGSTSYVNKTFSKAPSGSYRIEVGYPNKFYDTPPIVSPSSQSLNPCGSITFNVDFSNNIEPEEE